MSQAAAEQRFTNCPICREVPTGDLVELDLLMGDPTHWPASVWGIFKPPKGRMTPARQRFGAVEMGQRWLLEHGFEFSVKTIRNHYRYDVVVVAASVEELIGRGLIEKGEKKTAALENVDQLDPKAFLTFFNRGIKLGDRALGLMEKRIEDLVAAGEPIPFVLLKTLAEMGSKLAVVQAQIKARGQHWDDEGDEEEGFRAGAGPLPSPRMGHHRIRVIEGEARPVTDMGPADRERYNRRAEQEGSPKLPE